MQTQNKKNSLKHGIYLFLLARAQVAAILVPVRHGRYVRTHCKTTPFSIAGHDAFRAAGSPRRDTMYLSILLSSAAAQTPCCFFKFFHIRSTCAIKARDLITLNCRRVQRSVPPTRPRKGKQARSVCVRSGFCKCAYGETWSASLILMVVHFCLVAVIYLVSLGRVEAGIKDTHPL